MNQGEPRRYRAGDPLPDLCRACKVVRDHTVIVADGTGRPLRVCCDFCGSQHNYRGTALVGPGPLHSGPAGAAERPARTAVPLPLVSAAETTGAAMSMDTEGTDWELLLRRVLREELGLTPTVPAEKWRGGKLVLQPGRPGLQPKEWPIEALFHKIVMIRNRLRSLEQQVNASDLPEDAKLRLQAYVTGCYGSLTSFNVLFAEEADQFRGAGGE